MRRADRLFQILQILRRARGPLSGAAIAAELEVSLRTVYRDIADLMAQRVPIRGEAGVGYVLEEGFDMPPLMLTADEIEAAVLGAQWVASRGDADLARAAADLVAKIRAVVPERLRPYVENPVTRTPPARETFADGIDMARTRQAIRDGRKIALRYRDEAGAESRRTIWPVTLGYFDTTRLIIGWCELRRDFRHFRADRIVGAEFLEDRIPERLPVLRDRWLAAIRERPEAAKAAAG
ncbi:YafY family transcriptional regulator [Rhizobium sp. TRM95111]|uniref:helix-turn-helix transcriptional regulator n=1 Tax=Rhizobium alarense TaxID=2846851 RepID=UPI001F46B984|nr:YafY family protein [Rhizobium alarense]MCF3643262.1 YafY family transcriptional regulator [Rhizobium alarense]